MRTAYNGILELKLNPHHPAAQLRRKMKGQEPHIKHWTGMNVVRVRSGYKSGPSLSRLQQRCGDYGKLLFFGPYEILVVSK